MKDDGWYSFPPPKPGDRAARTVHFLSARHTKFSADEIEEAFTTFLSLRDCDETVQVQNFLIAIACAAEFKRRANRIGVTVLEYSRLTRVRRELSNS